MTRRLFVLPFFLLTLLLASARGQTYAFDSSREADLPLDGTWRFHTGDDPSYASPGFNDSNWPLLSSSNGWYEKKTYKDYRGFAWYRFRVQLPSQPNRPIALRVGMYSNYEIFADGVKLASCGTMPPAKATTLLCKPSIVLLPSSAPGKMVTIAIRCWTGYPWLGGPDRLARIGDPSLIRRLDQAAMDKQRFEDTQEDVMIVLEGLAGIAACILFLFRRTEAEYLWFGLIVACIAMNRGLQVYGSSHGVSVGLSGFCSALCFLGSELALIAFLSALFKPRRSILFYAAIIAQLLRSALSVPGLHLYQAMDRHLGRVNVIILVLFVLDSSFAAWVIGVLWRRARERRLDAQILLVPVSLLVLSGALQWANGIASELGWNHLFYNQYLVLFHIPYPVNAEVFEDLVFMLAMLFVLILRFSRSRAQQERLEADLEAARTVQQILIPEEIPAIAGLTIESAYFPAQEVGGDFFQILPQANGTTLVVLGDVAGHGLPAAMTVSLLVGAIRTLAEQTQSPGEMLNSLNRRLWGRSTGFATCLALAISEDGVMTYANAGHLNPYLDGVELPTDPNLPLGLIAESAYEEASVRLGPAQHLTLMTDGVLEATNAQTKALFGFERMRAISTQSAGQIADAARLFGQSDDITVLSLTLAAA